MPPIVKTAGPVFNRRFGDEVSSTVEEGIKSLTEEGGRRVQAQLVPGHGYKTGAFQRTIHGEMKDSQHGVVFSSNAMLGYWLETGKRRNEVTRFKGYHMFRKVRFQLAAVAKKSVETMRLRIIVKGNR